MIEALAIDHVACFGKSAPPLQPLRQINFVYGPNGSGKSSIAKEIHAVQHQDFTQEIFNKNFVDLLLSPDQRIPGVFVIRDGDPGVQMRIDQLIGKRLNNDGPLQVGEIENLEKKVKTLDKSLQRSLDLLNEAKVKLTKACWEKRKALPAPVQQAFRGFLGDSSKNFSEVLKVHNNMTAEPIKSEEEILAAYKTLGNESTEELQKIEVLSPLGNLNKEQLDLLGTPIKSKDETSFGHFARLLENSDWVRHGLNYLDESDEKCPFCQQSMDGNIIASLHALFDNFYKDQVEAIRSVEADETRRLTQVRNFLSGVRESLLDESSTIIDAAQSLQMCILTRKLQIERKIESPSLEIFLQDFSESELKIQELILSANERVDKVNALLRNRKRAIADLGVEVWRYYVHSVVGNDLSQYVGAILEPTKARENLQPKLDGAREQLRHMRAELSQLQQSLTSAAPTVENINNTLLSVGFLSFSIKHLDDDTYQLVRSDGTSASQTLSEGERNMISFLYYFHKLLRLNEDMSVSDGLVAVVDDPVSSLDGEMIFVINLLLRKMFEFCVKGKGRLGQVILLTHNAYFFKESGFIPKGVASGERSYFVLTKGSDGITTYKHYDKSPIKSNYTQLWDQVRAASKGDTPELSAWLPNAMRRIIENYFQITGGLDTDTVISKIPESDRWACQALLAWYNDGSHTVPWDVDYSSISSDAVTHIRAFRQIFDASGHLAHYKMMMEEPR